MISSNIMIVGVGGQGTLLASRVIGALAVDAGFDVKVSEVHGMSQRGGSVVTYVRFGEKVYSPIIDKGEADFIVAFEKIEAARYLPYLAKDGKIVVNSNETMPVSVITGAAEYPHGVLDDLVSSGVDVDALNALELAQKAGSAKAVNIVLLGRLAKYFDLPKEKWISAIEKTVNPKFIEMNKTAFELGYSI